MCCPSRTTDSRSRALHKFASPSVELAVSALSFPYYRDAIVPNTRLRSVRDFRTARSVEDWFLTESGDIAANASTSNTARRYRDPTGPTASVKIAAPASVRHGGTSLSAMWTGTVFDGRHGTFGWQKVGPRTDSDVRLRLSGDHPNTDRESD
jgi:hypothetical protein